MDIREKDLDKVFIGSWEITEIDDYKTPKSGKIPSNGVIRSKVNHKDGTITLYGRIHPRFGEQNVVMDGSVGIYSKITERALIAENTIGRVNFLWIKLITPDNVISFRKSSGEGYILETEAEIDDVVFNGDGDYTFPAKYFINIINKQPILTGLEINIPICKFNHYIHMRDLWYRDYKGSSVICSENSVE